MEINEKLLQSDKKKVEITIKFNKVSEINVLSESFRVDFFLEAKWKTDQKLFTYDLSKDWNPKLYIHNSINELKETIEFSLLEENADTFVIEKRKVTGKNYFYFFIFYYV